MNVAEALKDALYSYNKIALPGFGTFVTDYASAYIHPTQHLFQPPNKKISFAPELKTDDNLLLTYLTEFNKVSIEAAQKEIATFVKEIQYHLSINNNYVLEGIGEWYFDIEKQLHFKADVSVNYMKEAYGLPPFVAETITRKSNVPSKTLHIKAKNEKMSLATMSYIFLGMVILIIAVLTTLHFLHIIKY